MSNKEKIAIAVSAENLSWLDSNYNNRSSYINDLLTQAREGSGDIDTTLKRYQARQLEEELQSMQNQMETKQSRLETLQGELESDAKQQNEVIAEAREILEDDELEPDNLAVQNWADKAGLTPTELIAEVQDDGS